jgi:glutamyl-Q tRNA(Asp) synthetase
MSSGPILRFAPSPNGRLHLGHAFSALFTARAAASISGCFLLRIEDIDAQRSKPEFEAGIAEDLSWLGLEWPSPVLRQSTRMPAYAAAAQKLKERGLLYPCFCSRRQAAQSAGGADPEGAPLYSGTCRGLSQSEQSERQERGERARWRLKMDRAIAEAGLLSVEEAPASNQDAMWPQSVRRIVNPRGWADAVIVRKETPASYHLSVVVDDAAQGVTHVTRGMDLFAATALHILLQRLLDLPSPAYCHHRLILDRDGQKLSKSKGSPSLKDLREEGWRAADIRRDLGFG